MTLGDAMGFAWMIGVIVLVVVASVQAVRIRTLRVDVRRLQQIHDEEWSNCFRPMAQQISKHNKMLLGAEFELHLRPGKTFDRKWS